MVPTAGPRGSRIDLEVDLARVVRDLGHASGHEVPALARQPNPGPSGHQGSPGDPSEGRGLLASGAGLGAAGLAAWWYAAPPEVVLRVPDAANAAIPQAIVKIIATQIVGLFISMLS